MWPAEPKELLTPAIVTRTSSTVEKVATSSVMGLFGKLLNVGNILLWPTM
jgi:hypothetical protein